MQIEVEQNDEWSRVGGGKETLWKEERVDII